MEPSLIRDSSVANVQAGVGSVHDLIGRRIGPGGLFELQSRETARDDAEVWAAWMRDPRRPRRVAVKILHPIDGSAQEAALRAAREAAVHHELRDVAGVIALVDSGSFEHPVTGVTLRFVATEWIANARTIAAACEPLSWSDRIELFCDLTQTIDIIHKRGVVHGHLCDASVVIDENDIPWVIDFGDAQCIRDCDPPLADPFAHDVHALGRILHKCLTGQPPRTSPPIIGARLAGRTLPPSLQRALRQCLAAGDSASTIMPYTDAGEILWDLRPLVNTSARREWLFAGGVLLTAIAIAWFILTPALYRTRAFTNWAWAVSRLVEPNLTMEHVRMIALDVECTPDPVTGDIPYTPLSEQAIIKAKGLPETTSPRGVLAALVTRLNELGVRIAGLTFSFGGNTDPKKNAAFIGAIQAFEAANGGSTLVFPCEDWALAPGQTTMLDPGLAPLRGREHGIRVAISHESDRADYEVAYRSHSGGSRIAYSLRLAAATFGPGDVINAEVLSIGQDWARIELSFRNRENDRPARAAMQISMPIRSVKDVAEYLGWRPDEYASLDPRDQLVMIVVPRMPPTSRLDAATIKGEDLFDPAQEERLKRELAGKVVIVGDRLLSKVLIPNDEIYRVIGADRLWQTYEVQAVGTEACLNALTTSDAVLAPTFFIDVSLLMPISVLCGLGFAYVAVGRFPLRAVRSVVLASGALVVVTCVVATLLYMSYLITWNPFLVPSSFATAAMLGVLVPWLRI